MKKLLRIILAYTLVVAFCACKSEDMKVQKAFEEGTKEVAEVQRVTGIEVSKEQVKADKVKQEAINQVDQANIRLEDANTDAHNKIDDSVRKLNESKVSAERQIIEAVKEANENIVEAR